MPALPAEVWHGICKNLELENIKNLRLVCKTLGIIGAYYLFSTIDVGVEQDSVCLLKFLAKHPQFLPSIREIRLWTDVVEHGPRVTRLQQFLFRIIHQDRHRLCLSDLVDGEDYDEYGDEYNDDDDELDDIVDDDWGFSCPHRPQLRRLLQRRWRELRIEQLAITQKGQPAKALKKVLPGCTGLKVLSIKTYRAWKIWNTTIPSHCAEESFRLAGVDMLRATLPSLSRAVRPRKVIIDFVSWHLLLEAGKEDKRISRMRSMLAYVSNLELCCSFLTEHSSLDSNILMRRAAGLLEAASRLEELTVNFHDTGGIFSLKDLVGDMRLPCLKSINLSCIKLDSTHMLEFVSTHKDTLRKMIWGNFGWCDFQLLDLLEDISTAANLESFEFTGSRCDMKTSVDLLKCAHWVEVQYFRNEKKRTRYVHIERALNWLICGNKKDARHGHRDRLSKMSNELWGAITWDLISESQLDKLTQRGYWHTATDHHDSDDGAVETVQRGVRRNHDEREESSDEELDYVEPESEEDSDNSDEENEENDD